MKVFDNFYSKKIFEEKISFINDSKKIKLNNILSTDVQKIKNKPSFVKSINFVGREPVYDITVKESHEFISEGILVHNCSCYKKNDPKKPDLMEDFEIYELLHECDAFVVVSPIHWHSLSSQVKALFDRLVCINQTLAIDDARKIMGDDIKNSEVTGKLSRSNEYKYLLRNHLEGKVAAFYAHGDDGANDYEGKDLPDSYSDVLHDPFAIDPKSVVMPFVLQMKYSGVYVPDDLIQSFYTNKGIDYNTANKTFRKNKEFYERADSLIENLLNFLDK